MKWGKLSADVAGVRVRPRASVMDESPGPPNDPERVTFARLVRDSALELLLTFLMLFGVTSIVRWVITRLPQMLERGFSQVARVNPAAMTLGQQLSIRDGFLLCGHFPQKAQR